MHSGSKTTGIVQTVKSQMVHILFFFFFLVVVIIFIMIVITWCGVPRKAVIPCYGIYLHEMG